MWSVPVILVVGTVYCGGVSVWYVVGEVDFLVGLTIVDKYEIVLMAICLFKSVMNLISLMTVSTLLGYGGRESWLIQFYGINLITAIIQLLAMIILTLVLD